jgi:subtilisin family serine protease
MHRFLDAAYRKDIILIAAAGNGGPNAAPLYPGSDADVIAVTATDNNDAVFKLANRGDYIAIAAPGVDIMAAAPGGSYQFTSGTSIAAAHVSGTVALMLQKNPALKPQDVRAILSKTATPLGPKLGRSEVGAGLSNAYQAVKAADPGAGGPVQAKP